MAGLGPLFFCIVIPAPFWDCLLHCHPGPRAGIGYKKANLNGPLFNLTSFV